MVVSIIAGIYIVSPPHSLTIRISAEPQGIQEFYVVTRSSVPGFHGRNVSTIDKRMVPANRKTKIPLNFQTHWFGLISTTMYHPEYFSESQSATNNYVLPETNYTPAAWKDALSNRPRWVIQSISMSQSPESYEAEKKRLGDEFDSHQAIHMSHVHFHINSINSEYLDIFLRTNSIDRVQKSVELLDIVVKEFDDGMLEASIPTFGPTEYVQKQIDETHAALNEIHEKIK